MIIRASMLPSWADCPRRGAARQFRNLVENAGFTLASERVSISARVGTALHDVARAFYEAKISGTKFDLESSVAVVELPHEEQGMCDFDKTTPSRNAAEEQISRMMKEYIGSVGNNVEPIAVELKMEADIGSGWLLTGHADLLARHPSGAAHVRDIKTGATNRTTHHGQLGAYSLLVRSQSTEGIPNDVAQATVDFLPRTKKQPLCSSRDYDLDTCEEEAQATIQRIKESVERFIDSGSPHEFAANPRSMACGASYCIAHGTDFCPLTKDDIK